MTDKPTRLSRYIIPAVISMLVVGTNANIDGFFIGRILGDDGLAAINIVWPIVAAIASLGTGIGLGGAVLLSRTRGTGNTDEAERIKNTTLLLLFLVGVLSGGLFYLLSKPLLIVLGAEDAVLGHANSYAAVISAGALCQVLGAGLPVLLRNNDRNWRAMLFALVGLGLHIGLDFGLAECYGMPGVAAATVISQGVMALLCFLALPLRPRLGIAWRSVGRILGESAAPFGLNFVPSLSLLFTNYFALSVGGVAAVSAYATMSYAVYTFDYVFQGVCDGIQPVVSFARGAQDVKEERHALSRAVITLGGIVLVSVGLTPLLIAVLPDILGASDEAAHMIAGAFWLYALSYPFKATGKLLCSYYYATGRQGLANLLVFIDPLLFTPLCLILLPRFIGISGVWLSLPLAQILLTCVGVAVVLIHRHRAHKIC